MKQLTMTIETCDECIYIDEINRGIKHKECSHPKTDQNWISDSDATELDIPEWCPLPDTLDNHNDTN